MENRRIYKDNKLYTDINHIFSSYNNKYECIFIQIIRKKNQNDIFSSIDQSMVYITNISII